MKSIKTFSFSTFRFVVLSYASVCPQSVKNQNAPCVFQKEKFRPELLTLVKMVPGSWRDLAKIPPRFPPGSRRDFGRRDSRFPPGFLPGFLAGRRDSRRPKSRQDPGGSLAGILGGQPDISVGVLPGFATGNKIPCGQNLPGSQNLQGSCLESCQDSR